jgi:hypothetical protein
MAAAAAWAADQVQAVEAAEAAEASCKCETQWLQCCSGCMKRVAKHPRGVVCKVHHGFISCAGTCGLVVHIGCFVETISGRSMLPDPSIPWLCAKCTPSAPSHVPLSPTASAATLNPEVPSNFAPQCTLPQSETAETSIMISSDQSSSDLEQFTPAAATPAAAAAAASLRRTARMQCKRDSSSSSRDDDIAPSPTELLPRLRPRKPPVQHSSSESEATDSGMYSILFKESALQCRHSHTPSYTTAMQSGVAAHKPGRRGTAKKSTHSIPPGTKSVCFAV